MDRPFDILSLCSGNGIGDIALRLAVPGARTRIYVENEAHACAALVRSMEAGALAPGARIWNDLRTFDARPFAGALDCIVATYPCQPFSDAGLRLGESDPRHLWPVIREIIRITNPPLVFLENVRGHLRRGFDSVCRDLQGMGYATKAGLWSAEEMGAPHGRIRLFAVAYRHAELGNAACQLYNRAGHAGPVGRRESANTSEQLAEPAGAGPSRWPHRTGNRGEALRIAPIERGSAQLADGVYSGLEERTGIRSHVEPQFQTPAERTRAQLAVAGSDRRRERSAGNDHDGRDASGDEPDGCDPRILYFPPYRTGDWERWNRVLVRSPWLRPAVASAEVEHLFFGMADGLAHQLEFRRNRVDRIRAVGNGICPVAMAVAFCLLCEAHGIGRIEPDGFVLSEEFYVDDQAV